MFDYRPGSSPVHILNPVTKLAVAAGLTVIVFLLPNLWGPALLAVALLGVAAAAGFLGSVAKLAAVVTGPLLVAVVLIQGIFYPGNETPLVEVGPVTFWEEGVYYGLLVFFRVLVVVCAVSITVFSTHPKAMMVAFIDKGLSPKLAYVFMASLQFIPEMQRRARAIIEAQQSRGLDIQANLRRRFQALLAMMIPLLTGALISVETRSLALEARGFSRGGLRNHLIEVPDRTTDRVIRWSMAAIVVLVAVWRIVL
jgi:energy-coupling factor transport system permease protein